MYETQTCIPFLGIDVNVKTGISPIPEEKLTVIVEMCAQSTCKAIRS